MLVKCALVLCAAVAVSGLTLGPQDVVFHLFTRNNPTVSEPLLPTFNSILGSNMFSPTHRTVITIHSFGETVGGNFNAFVVPAHLSSEDVNLVAVDWSPGSPLYTVGLGNAPQAGQVIANFVNILINSFGYQANLVRIVGVGLGGHIAGIAARNIVGEVPHIIALDPSLHGWTHNENILNPDDAGVVEVLYTTAGELGYDLPLGDLNFYPNGGRNQAGCVTVECSHIYSYAFYAESLTVEVNGGNTFLGTRCESYEQATALSCDGERDETFGGTAVKTRVSGIYSFITNFTPPFARG